MGVQKDHPTSVSVSAVAPDGSWLATSGHDTTVRIWDTVTGRVQAALSARNSRLTVMTAAPDGNWLAIGSEDETVRIADTVTGRRRATLRGHGGWVEVEGGGPP